MGEKVVALGDFRGRKGVDPTLLKRSRVTEFEDDSAESRVLVREQFQQSWQLGAADLIETLLKRHPWLSSDQRLRSWILSRPLTAVELKMRRKFGPPLTDPITEITDPINEIQPWVWMAGAGLIWWAIR